MFLLCHKLFMFMSLLVCLHFEIEAPYPIGSFYVASFPINQKTKSKYIETPWPAGPAFIKGVGSEIIGSFLRSELSRGRIFGSESLEVSFRATLSLAILSNSTL